MRLHFLYIFGTWAFSNLIVNLVNPIEPCTEPLKELLKKLLYHLGLSAFGGFRLYSGGKLALSETYPGTILCGIMYPALLAVL